jgi:formylglycine-generating enzyme required for sulfatase activity
LRELARRGSVLFLLDGVDEVPANERPAVWDAIAALDQGVYGGNRWVATCRVLSFDKNEAPDGVSDQDVQILQSLDEAQIIQFIENWYAGLVESGQLSREQGAAKAVALKQAVQQPELYELAQNPMLLTIMALVQTFRGTLPDERAGLYQACVEALLLRWQLHIEGEGGDNKLPDALRALGTTEQDLQRLLWEIAWVAHSKAADRTRSADIPRWEVLEIAETYFGSLGKGEQFLAYTEQRAHLLVGHGGRRERVYRFPHRTFQEYLAACHLAAQRRFGLRAKELAVESDTWREVLNLAVGILAFNQNNREKAFDAVEQMLPRRTPEAKDWEAWRQVWLAGEMCVTIGRQAAERDEVGQELLPRLRDLLVALLENEALTAQQRAEAGDALGRLGDPRPGVCTLEPALIEIPAGAILYGEAKERRTIEQPYAIARYPVTVAQFEQFVQDRGYEEASYWGGEESQAWRWRLSEHPKYRGEGAVTQPEYWQQARWHVANRPMVGVSLYEVQAYCAWLSARSGRVYRLPTEEEWERAARYTDGRDYPWGTEWADGIINTLEAKIGRTTAVGTFPRGRAECGAEDMSGNVWEWTTSFYDRDEDRCCVRGGSWGLNRDYALVAFRFGGVPMFSDGNSGFRLVSHVI